MKEIVVISGKGGTGKTSLAGAFASLADEPILADCDVDAPDLHILTSPIIREKRDFVGSQVAAIDSGLCTRCRACLEACRFGAISEDFAVGEFRCENCGVCQLVCPAGAVAFKARRSGVLFISDTRFGPMVHAKLDTGEEVSGKLVSEVKQVTRTLARDRGKELIIVDGPPGIGCPVIASISGADYLVVVTEPTISAEEDMKRALALAEHFGIPAGVCINKATINPSRAEGIAGYCSGRGIELLGRLPYDHIMTRAMTQFKTVIELGQSSMAGLINEVWQRVCDRVFIT